MENIRQLHVANSTDINQSMVNGLNKTQVINEHGSMWFEACHAEIKEIKHKQVDKLNQ